MQDTKHRHLQHQFRLLLHYTCKQTFPMNQQATFFAEFSARRQRPDASDNDITTEVDRYLADSSSDLQSLHEYTHIRNVYISLNTRLPASAAVERLFSLGLGGRVFAPLRCRLSSEHFEMMTFLRIAKWWQYCTHLCCELWLRRRLIFEMILYSD